MNHSPIPSVGVCPRCRVGYCQSCEKRVQITAICPICSGVCVTPNEYVRIEDRERRRGRSLFAETSTILGYPLRDRLGFVVLSIFIGFFGVAASIALFGGGVAVLLSQGILYAYVFHAVSRVSDGDLKPVMPDVTGLWDLVRPLLLALATAVICWGPALVAFGIGFVADLDDGPRAVVFLIGGLMVVWGVLYTPAAMTVAALTERIGSTLNPALGLLAIRCMGSIYWQALAIVVAIAVTQETIGYAIDLMGWPGLLVKPFVTTYGSLAIGCALGLAVFKRAPQMGLS